MSLLRRSFAMLALGLLLALTGCGGGGGSSSPTAPAATPPSISSQPSNALVEAGQPATFSVAAAAGSGAVTYQWQRNGADITGATSASYTVPATTSDDSGASYRVTLTNGAGSVTSSPALLTVSATPLPPQITAQPNNTTVAAGNSATFTVTANSLSTMSYQWLRDGTAIPGATGASYATPATQAADNGATFSVVLTNAGGSTLSTAATLQVNTPPDITAQPAAATAFVGQTATFSVNAIGTATLAYQWKRNGVVITGATQASYTTATLSLSDQGAVFSVDVSNAFGAVTSAAATLTVNPPPPVPVIATQPQSVTVLAGRTATFSVSASSPAALTYQWRRNGVDIAGANASTYTTDTLAYTESGSRFSVVVSNSAGAVTSRDAVLTVNPRIVQVGAGGYVATARKEDGSVWNWGWTKYLGISAVLNGYGHAVAVKNADGSTLRDAAVISTGYGHTLVLRSDGSLWAWGDNSEGSLGNGSLVDAGAPVRVTTAAGAPFTGVTALSGGWRFTLALRSDSSVWAWGYALDGRLGNNNSSVSGPRRWLNPVAVQDTTGAPLTGVSQIEAGNDHSLALKSDGTVWIWGNGQGGILGDGQRNSRAYTAQRLNDSTGAAIANVVQVSAGNNHSVVLRSDGTALAWGDNYYGQLGDGTTTERDWATVVRDASGNVMTGIAAVYAGDFCTAFLMTDGSVWMVGRNSYGELGNGSTAPNSAIPVRVTYADGRPLTGVRQLALFDSTVVVLLADDTAWAWGDDQSGELDITPTNAVQFYRFPQKLAASGD